MKKEFEDTIIIDYTDVLPGDDAPDPLAPEDLEKQAKAAARDAPLSLEPTPPPPAPPAPPVLQP
ncbi:MAG TPA: hypothetical protein VIB01_11760, partial [Steroidobacteraceae bacterium]